MFWIKTLAQVRISIPCTVQVSVYIIIHFTLWMGAIRVMHLQSQIKLNRGIPVPFALYKPHISVYIVYRTPGHAGGSGSVMSHDTGGGGPGRVQRQEMKDER